MLHAKSVIRICLPAAVTLSAVQASTMFERNTMNESLTAADHLVAQGYLDSAKHEYEKLLESTPDNPDVIEKLGFVFFLKGQYREATERFSKVIELTSSKKRTVLIYTAFANYMMGDYAGAISALESAGSPNVGVLNLEQLKRLQKQRPYQVQSSVHKQVIPFEMLDPLPVVRITVNSKALFVMIDTGGVQLVLDEKFAAENSIQPLSRQDVKGFAGDKTAAVSFAIADSLELGDITMRNVPVWLEPTRQLCPASEWGLTIDGVLGTEVLMQFLPTFDFPNRRLILRAKSGMGRAEVDAMHAKVKIPFVIDGIHNMYAQALINGKGPVMMCFDSGLADDRDASLCLWGAALRELGIPEPELTREGMGGGGPVKYGYVDIASVKVDKLVRERQRAVYANDERPLQGSAGFKTYGVISHNFLKHYSWTIDFDNRVFLFDY
jgi:hypothetical protein